VANLCLVLKIVMKRDCVDRVEGVLLICVCVFREEVLRGGGEKRKIFRHYFFAFFLFENEKNFISKY